MSRISSINTWMYIADFIFATISSTPSSSRTLNGKMFCGSSSALALSFPDDLLEGILPCVAWLWLSRQGILCNGVTLLFSTACGLADP